VGSTVLQQNSDAVPAGTTMQQHSVPNMCEFLHEKLHLSCAFPSELLQGLTKHNIYELHIIELTAYDLP
jgi:hypothetical protein